MDIMPPILLFDGCHVYLRKGVCFMPLLMPHACLAHSLLILLPPLLSSIPPGSSLLLATPNIPTIPALILNTLVSVSDTIFGHIYSRVFLIVLQFIEAACVNEVNYIRLLVCCERCFSVPGVFLQSSVFIYAADLLWWVLIEFRNIWFVFDFRFQRYDFRRMTRFRRKCHYILMPSASLDWAAECAFTSPHDISSLSWDYSRLFRLHSPRFFFSQPLMVWCRASIRLPIAEQSSPGMPAATPPPLSLFTPRYDICVDYITMLPLLILFFFTYLRMNIWGSARFLSAFIFLKSLVRAAYTFFRFRYSLIIEGWRFRWWFSPSCQ